MPLSLRIFAQSNSTLRHKLAGIFLRPKHTLSKVSIGKFLPLHKEPSKNLCNNKHSKNLRLNRVDYAEMAPL